MRVPFGVWVIAGVLAGALGASALVLSGALDRDEDPTDSAEAQVAADAAEAVRAREASADAFVEAWERSRMGTYVVESTFERTLADGGTFTADRTVAQRPPSRLEATFGSVTARTGRRVVLCGSSARVYRCQASPARRSYEALVADEVAALRTHVEGSVPLYSVVEDGDCFDLAQVRPLPAPPYGTAARFCFDEETGAVTSLRIERDEATDVTEATRVRAEVRARDLRPPETGDPVAPGGDDGDEG